MKIGAIKNEDKPILVEFKELLDLNDQKKGSAVQVLLDRYQNDIAKLLLIKQCLKVWGIKFDADEYVPEFEVKYHDAFPPAIFGKYFNGSLYPKAYALCKLAYEFEKNGIPEEHATKFAVLFHDDKSLLEYLSNFSSFNNKSRTPLHDAALFTLPDFREVGFLEDTGCKFELFKKLAMTRENMLNPKFRELLPFAWELQKRIVTAKANLAPGIKPDKKSIETKKQEVVSLQAKLKKLEKKKSKLTEEEKTQYNSLPNEISKMLRELANLSSGKLLKDLDAMELRGFYELLRDEGEKEYKIFLDNGIPAKFYAEFKALNRNEAGKYIPDVKVDGEDIGYPGYYLMKVDVADVEQAARAACFGKLTNCCQSLSGEAGHSCVIHGLTNPNGGFYVLCKGDSFDPQLTDKVVGQCWAWRSESNAIVFDSIEISDSRDAGSATKLFFDRLALEIVRKNMATKVVCGGTSGISNKFGTVLELFKEYPINYTGYRDSKTQRVIIDTQRPYLTVTGDDLPEEVMAFIKKILSNSNFKKDNALAEMINWAVLTKKDRFIEKIKDVSRDLSIEADVAKIINEITEFLQENSSNEILNKIDDFPCLAFIETQLGITPLNVAAQYGECDKVDKLIKAGVMIDKKDATGRTPLSYAVEKNNVDLVNIFIENKADLNQKDNDGLTPLMHAICEKNTDIALMLINNGAYYSIRDNKNSTALSYAATYGCIDIANKILNLGANIEDTDSQGNTALHHAADHGSINIVQLLIKNSANVNVLNNDNETPLMCAAKRGFDEIVKLLIDHDAKIDEKGELGETALIRAIKAGKINTALVLIEHGANLNEKDDFDNSAWQYAQENPNMLSAIMKKCKEIQEKRKQEQHRKTPMTLTHSAVETQKKTDIVQKSSNPHSFDENGNNALHRAVLERNYDDIEKLLDAGLDPSIKQNKRDGKTALQLAEEAKEKAFNDLIDTSYALESETRNSPDPEHAKKSKEQHLKIIKTLEDNEKQLVTIFEMLKSKSHKYSTPR